MAYIDDIERVRAILGDPNPATARKIQSRLNERMIGFIQASPLLMLATVDAEGFPTISPKGDDPGFVKVVDDQTLLLPCSWFLARRGSPGRVGPMHGNGPMLYCTYQQERP